MVIKWRETTPDTFLSRRPKIRVKMLKKFYDTDTQVRITTINSVSKWNEFAKTCILPWYNNSLSWSNPSAANLGLTTYALQHPAKLWNKEITLMAAFHTLLKTRLIVDGCHRAVAVETSANERQCVPNTEVIECYGSQLHAIFPCDFCNLISPRLQ